MQARNGSSHGSSWGIDPRRSRPGTLSDVNETGIDLELQADGRPVVCGTTGQFGFGVDRDFLMIRSTPMEHRTHRSVPTVW